MFNLFCFLFISRDFNKLQDGRMALLLRDLYIGVRGKSLAN